MLEKRSFSTSKRKSSLRTVIFWIAIFRLPILVVVKERKEGEEERPALTVG
jgi:hypothetical protein